MEFTFDIDLGMKFGKEKALQIVDASCALTMSKGVRNLVESYKTDGVTNNLANSFFYEVDEATISGIVVANTDYARIQEEGGDILPKDAKALAIPLHPDAKKTAIPEGSSIRNVFPDLVLIQRDGAHPLLVRKKDKVFDLMYVLVSKVHLEGKHYLKNALATEPQKVLQKFRVN